MRLVTVPGIGGSEDSHWQSRWESAEAERMRRIRPGSWTHPDHTDWCDALDRAVGEDRAVLVAHSLGCLVAVDWAREHPDRVAGLFLVAVPDPCGAAFPAAAAASFLRDRRGVVPVPGMVIASSDDPYCDVETSRRVATDWAMPHLDVGAHGHLNADSGLGDWPDGRALLTAFLAGLRG